ncbi:hypothetical protein P12x_003157 [Tundrisphaera lichenicola]|uniref:hypothetical protein n=1 Tax=Tundrisphaera lichenicola TaxID=2029860 RepID=UPI003EBDDE46
MAASSNESFGLKIATAFSIALAVVLLISVYFLNSNYNIEYEKRVKAEADAGKANTAVRTATESYNEMRTALGYPAIEEIESVRDQMKKDQVQLKAEIEAINTEVTEMITQAQQKGQAKGTDAAQFEALKARAREIADAFLNNPDQSYKAQVTRLKDLTANQAKLTTALALNYIDVRRDLELANEVNAQAKAVVENGLAAAKTELDDTIRRDEEVRETLVKDNREKAETIANTETRLTNIVNENYAKSEKSAKTISELNAVLRDVRDQQARKEDVMNKPGGRVTFVDYGSGTVRVNVNRAQGVRPLMRFTIFDKNAVGITSDRPKAAVELIKVGDPARGENDSLARIVKTYDPADPIRYNDYIFSVGWSYDHPQRFALIGKIDVNRDGRDDRGDLIRMIEASGGVIEYDLPPPGTDRSVGQAAVARAFDRLGEPLPAPVGRASGKISGLAFGYVIDTRPSLLLFQPKTGEPTKEDIAYLQEESQATKEARDNGVRPLPLEKLLNMLGYDFSAPIEGRREAFDKGGVQELVKPKPPGPTSSN